MYQLTYIALGAFAALSSAVVFSSTTDEPTRIISGTLAMALWSYWAISSFRVVQITDTGAEVVASYQGMAAIGMACGAVMLLSVARLVFDSMGTDLAEDEPMGARR